MQFRIGKTPFYDPKTARQTLLAALGPLLGHSWTALGRFWVALEPLWGRTKPAAPIPPHSILCYLLLQ